MTVSYRIISHATRIRRKRTLPLPGSVTVRIGQTVQPEDVVATGNIPPKHRVLEVAQGLAIHPDQAEEYIQCQEGSEITEGDLLAGPVGLTRRVLRAPCDGRIVLIYKDKIILQPANKTFELTAGYPGKVVELVDNRGIIIEATGSLIQGVWGTGQVAYGKLAVLDKQFDYVLDVDQNSGSYQGRIVVFDYCENEDLLIGFNDLSASGLILAGLNPDLVPLALELKLPVIVLGGMGKYSFSPKSFDLLSARASQEVTINCEQRDRYTGVRPEIFLPQEISDPIPPGKSDVALVPGQLVIINSEPYFGNTGTIHRILGEIEFPNSSHAEGVEITLHNGEQVIIPLTNIEGLLDSSM